MRPWLSSKTGKKNPSRTNLGFEELSPEQDWLPHEYNIMVMTMTLEKPMTVRNIH